MTREEKIALRKEQIRKEKLRKNNIILSLILACEIIIITMLVLGMRAYDSKKLFVLTIVQIIQLQMATLLPYI